MSRLALISDLHIDSDGRHFAECMRVLHWIADDIRARTVDGRGEVDAILIGGDVFEKRPTPRDVEAACVWIRRLAGVAPVVVVYGNHDVERSLAPLGMLDTAYPVSVLDVPGVVQVESDETEPLIVACLPWPRRGALMAAAGHALSASESATICADLLGDVVRGLGAQAEEIRGEGKNGVVLLAHAMVRGSRLSTGQPLIGAELEVGVEDLCLSGADFIALAHIHRQNDWTHGNTPVVYPGAPYRTSYGETEPKGYVLAEVSRGAATWQLIETPATPMVLLAGAWTDGALVVGRTAHYLGVRVDDGLAPLGIVGADVRLRYEVQDQDRAAARAAAAQWREALLAAGAVAVKVEEEVRSTQAARAPAVAAAVTLADKARALWAAQGRSLEAGQAAAAVASIEGIDAGIRGAA
jgi:exonuclease SbcD